MQGWPPFPFALTPKARQAGAVALKMDTVHYGSAQMNQMLSEWIYESQSPDDLIRPAWMGALGIFVLGLVLAIPRDRARVRMLESDPERSWMFHQSAENLWRVLEKPTPQRAEVC